MADEARRNSIAGGSIRRRSSIMAPLQRIFRRSSKDIVPLPLSRPRAKSVWHEDPYKEVRSKSVCYVDIDPFNIEFERPLSFLQSNNISLATESILPVIAENELEDFPSRYTYVTGRRRSSTAIQGRRVNKHHRATMVSLEQLGGYKSTEDREIEMMSQLSLLQHLEREDDINNALARLEKKIMQQNNAYLQQFYEDDSIEYVRKMSH